MTVSNELETFIRRLNLNFNVQRDGSVLRFTVNPERQNAWFTLTNVIFDYDEQNVSINYMLDDINYECSANIADDTPLDFGIANIFAENINAPLLVLKILVFILGFNNEYELGRALDLASRNERTINYMGLSLTHRRVS